MKSPAPRRVSIQLTEEQKDQLRKDRELIANELPELIAKHEVLCEGAKEDTPSGALRRAIHTSKLLFPDLADAAGTDMGALDAFLMGEQTLTSDVIDRLARILNLRLEVASQRPE
jgi:hypothetical protein